MAEEFHPEKEVRDILKAPSKARRTRLEAFKEQYAYQTEGLMRLQARLTEIILENPDISREGLWQHVESFGKEFGFPPEYYRIIESVLKQYREKREQAKEMRLKYPDDEALFTALFGRRPAGKVEVIESPMALYFRLHSPEDYAYVYLRAFVSGREITQKDLDIAKRAGGVFMGPVLFRGFTGLFIIADNVSRKLERAKELMQEFKEGKATLEAIGLSGYVDQEATVEEMTLELFERLNRRTKVHEERHAIIHLFDDIMQQQLKGGNTVQEIIRAINRSDDDGEKKRIMERYFRQQRRHIDWEAQQEILSFFMGGGLTFEQILEKLIAPKGAGGIYDYGAEELPAALNKIAPDLEDEDIVLARNVAARVFGEEYRRTLEDGLETIKRLKESGYSSEEIFALLVYRPLREWKKVAHRQLASKRLIRAK